MNRPRELNWRLAAAALALLVVHVGLLIYFFGFGSGGGLPQQPFTRGDFATHAAQTRRVLVGLEAFGEPWVYDSFLLAGAPNGVLFDADVKAWELWTWILVKLGVGWGRAYNAFVLAVHVSVPLLVYGSARLFRLDRAAALVAVGLGMGLWFFDSFVHWMWFIGTITYCAAAVFALIPLGLFYRWIEDRKPGFALACALTLAFAHLLHPYSFFILVWPMLALYLRAAWTERSLSLGEHAITIAIALFTLLANLWWLVLALRFIHYLLDSAHYAQGGVQYLLFDLLALIDDPGSQGMIAPRTAVRLLCLVTAILGLRSWRVAGDRRRMPIVVLLVALACLTYLGGYTFFGQIQPYRHNLPLGFVLVIPAATWLRTLAPLETLRRLDPGARGLALVLAALACVHLTRDVLYFFAGSMQDRRTLEDGREVIFNTIGHLYVPSYRYTEQDDWEDILAEIRTLDRRERDQAQGAGRWLIQDQVFGEYVMARTDAQVLGGFELRNIEHSDANWFRRAGRNPPFDADALRRYCEDYAVRWVLVRKGDLDPWWDQQPELLRRIGFASDIIIYRVNVDTRLIDGTGELEVGFNRLAVRASAPDQDVVLRFHGMETLVCEPDCVMEKVEVEGDRVGFIRVPAPHPADFVISNSYQWPGRTITH